MGQESYECSMSVSGGHGMFTDLRESILVVGVRASETVAVSEGRINPEGGVGVRTD